MTSPELTLPPEYEDRGQAYIKHLFLRTYLDDLLNKIASFADTITYVDGFSGPWKSADERFGDTSFGIALAALTRAKSNWRSLPQGKTRDVTMQAVLVEEQAAAFRQLRESAPSFPDVDVRALEGDFTQVADKIADLIPPDAFSFVFVDPTGFKLDLEKLRPLISRKRSEVVFNFMFDYANRFPGFAMLEQTYDRLLPGVDWKTDFKRLEADPATTPAERKGAIVGWFKEAVRSVGGYEYVADVDIRYPGRDRTFYVLVYGTRKPAGLKVFRDCQIKALEAQSKVGSWLRSRNADLKGQPELPGIGADLGQARFAADLQAEASRARDLLLTLVPPAGFVLWRDAWPRVLSDCVITEGKLGAMVNELRKSAVFEVPDWTTHKRKPNDDYRLQRGANYPLL